MQGQCRGLSYQQFVLHLVLFEDIFRVTKFASDQLQSPNLDISSANDLIQSVITALSEKRSEEYWSDIQNRANELCGKVGLASGSTPQRRDAQQRQRLYDDDFIIEAPINRAHSSNDDLLTDCFYQVVDRLVSELTRRFSKDADDVLTGVSALSPQHKSFLDKKCLLPMAQFYSITEENLNAEMHQVRRLLERKTNQGHSIKNTSELLLLMEPYKDAFMDLHKLILISLTLPVTSVSFERSFSCLRRLKTYLRSNCGDVRNSDLALLAINTRRAKALEVQRIIDAFAVNHNNRCIVLV